MFELIQVVYWLALSTWFGGVLFVAVAAPVIFRTVREAHPTLPTVLSVNLEDQHDTLLAGSIVSNLLKVLRWVQLACAGVLLLTMIAQWVYIDRSGSRFYLGLARNVMYMVAVVFLIYDWFFVWPRVQRYRDEYIEHADEPEIANPAKDHFDRWHHESVTVLRNILFMLLGIVLFSGGIQLRGTTFTFGP